MEPDSTGGKPPPQAGTPGPRGGPATDALIRLPADVAVDGEGNLYVAAINRVRRVDEATGMITTFAGTGERGVEGDGGPATEARLDQPWGLAVTRDGRVYLSDSRNNRVRRIAADGALWTVAGGEAAGDAGDGGLAIEATLNEPHGLCLYGGDVLLVCDNYNNRIKAIRLAE